MFSGIFSIYSTERPSARCVALLLLGVCLSFSIGSNALSQEVAASASDIEFFEKRVRPLLVEHCYSCHSASSKKLQAGLRVDHRAGMIAGGDSGEALVPGDPEASLLMESVNYESYEMPPKGKLPDEDIAVFEEWIRGGAPWPEEEIPQANQSEPEPFSVAKRRDQHWVWQPVRSPQPPAVKNTQWPLADLDRFILAKLEQNNLPHSGDADRNAMLRRVYFDLTGLPPTLQQTQAFQKDDSASALEKIVDQLLTSPHYGERWGRHWLDLVRYAESRGHEFDDDATNAYQYRDYIIRALNADVPYDQLVREHIAGDLLLDPRVNPDDGFNESVLGTGFWFLGEWVHSPVDILKDESDRFDNMVDVMSKTFLGVTVSCARCHDHKFDAISTADYYSLTGFLQSSNYREVRFESLEHNRRIAKQIAELDLSYRQNVSQLMEKEKTALPQPDPMPAAINKLLVMDYQTLTTEQHMQDGFIFGDRPRRMGQAYLDVGGDEPAIRFASRGCAASDGVWNELQTTGDPLNNRSKLTKLPRSGRTLRTPTFELTSDRVACRVRGSGHLVACVDSHRHIAGPLHKQTVQTIKEDAPWITMNLSRYIGHRIHLEFTPASGAQLEVFLIIQGNQKSIRRAVAAEYSVEPLETPIAADSDALQQLANDWSDRRGELKSQIKNDSHTAMAMMDGTGEDAHVLIRGSSSNPGKIEPRHFLSAITGDQPLEISKGSGRVELAAQINDRANPLTSRVIVNRVWHHLMGRGIVPTTDDFGVLGQRPTHPELLDHLASQFNQDGRSIKRLIKRIVLSRTYQMSSKAVPAAVEADPNNLLWHHRPPKRLQSEALRDSLLALSGQLDSSQFGPSVPVHLTDFMDGRGRPKKSGPQNGNGRRSIYLEVRRNFLSPFMLAFDTPAPFSCMGRRNVSNVPAQSLILMNDPFVIEQAKGWADRAMENGETVGERIEWLYVTALARRPTEQEVMMAEAYIGTGGESSQQKWHDFAHALVNTKEFVFIP